MKDVRAPGLGRTSGHVLQTCLFIAMELAWIAALALFFDAAIEGSGSAAMGIVCALYPVALVVDGLISRTRFARWAAFALHGAAFCVAATAMAVLVLPTGGRIWSPGDQPLTWIMEDPAGHRLAALLGLALFCWVRGALLSGRQLNAHVVALGFQIGLVVLLAVLWLSSAFEVDWPGAAALTLVFVLCGLLALWHVRASAGEGRDGIPRRNPSAAFIGLTLVLGVALGIGAGIDRSLLDALVALVTRFLEAIVASIAFLFGLLPDMKPGPVDMPERPRLPAPSFPTQEEPRLSVPEFLRQIFKIIFFGIVAIMVSMILLANLRDLLAWLRQRRDYTPGLDYDRSKHRLGDTLRHLLQALLKVLLEMFHWLRSIFSFRRSEPQPSEPIRQAYARLGRQLSDRGWPRRPSETAFDYARRMKAVWPAPAGDLDTLTRAYVRERYGRPRGVPAERLRRFLKKIRRSLRKVRYRELNADTAGRPTERN